MSTKLGLSHAEIRNIFVTLDIRRYSTPIRIFGLWLAYSHFLKLSVKRLTV